jgi:hypothetical protein
VGLRIDIGKKKKTLSVNDAAFTPADFVFTPADEACIYCTVPKYYSIET